MDSKDFVNRFKAASKILKRQEIDLEAFEDLRELIKGIDPEIDKKLESCSKAFKTAKKLQKKKYLELSQKLIKQMPTETKEEKRRKKALLLFLRYWKQLKSEVKRVQKTYHTATEEDDPSLEKKITIADKITKLFKKTKGPFGLITVAAGIIVGVQILFSYLTKSSVDIIIKNVGCDPIRQVSSQSISIPDIPGLKLPNKDIPSGGSAIATLPPLKVVVDGTQEGVVKISALKLSMDFQLENEGINFYFNNQELLGNRTEIDLKQKPKHELVVSCE